MTLDFLNGNNLLVLTVGNMIGDKGMTHSSKNHPIPLFRTKHREAKGPRAKGQAIFARSKPIWRREF